MEWDTDVAIDIASVIFAGATTVFAAATLYFYLVHNVEALVRRRLANERSLYTLIDEFPRPGRLAWLWDRLALFNRLTSKWFGPIGGWRQMDRCLLIAFIYPFTLLLLTRVFGGPNQIAGLEIISNNQPIVQQLYSLLVLLISTSGVFLIFKNLDSVGSAVARSVMRGLPVSLATGLGKVLSVLLVAVATAFVIFISNISGFVIFAPVAVAIAVFANGTASIALAGVIVAISFAPYAPIQTDADVAGLAVLVAYATFFVVLPLLNATLDYASWTITRWLLHSAERPGRKWAMWKLGGEVIIDVILAAVCLVGLAFVLVWGVESVNLAVLAGQDTTIGPDDEAIPAVLTRQDVTIDWRSQVALARTDPFGAGLLVTMMLCSTLVPTILHLALGLGGLLGLAQTERRWVRDGLVLLAKRGVSPADPVTLEQRLAQRIAVDRVRPWFGAVIASGVIGIAVWAGAQMGPAYGTILIDAAERGANTAHWLFGA